MPAASRVTAQAVETVRFALNQRLEVVCFANRKLRPPLGVKVRGPRLPLHLTRNIWVKIHQKSIKLLI